MYLQHFGLREFPFSLTPNTEYFFNEGPHHEALNVLLVAIRSGEGFIKITGEVGTGKTQLCRQLLKALDRDFSTAYVPNPFINANGLRMALADELGLDLPRNLGQHRVLRAVTDRLLELNQDGRPVVLVLDEAQSMPEETLEALRLLTNLETERLKLLQVVLFGQPELDERLARTSLRQLRQRITFSYALRPLARDTVDRYLNHRLQIAGYQGEPLFDARARAGLFDASGGVPRLVNVLGHKAMMAAYGEGQHYVRRHHVSRAAADTEETRHRRRRTPVFWWSAFGMVLTGVAAWWLYGSVGL